MKIAILTMPLVTNYGAILQAYALKTVLEQMGHEVTFIERSRRMHLKWWKAPVVYAYRLFKKYVLKDRYVQLFYERNNNQTLDEEVITSKYTGVFVKDNFNIRHIKEYSDIQEHDYDAFIVGSDQVWRHIYSRGILGSTPATYLDFTHDWNIKRISYAASFGSDWWEMDENLTALCAKLLAKFDAVSVREEYGVTMCSKCLHCEQAVHVLDPTMLLAKESYIKLFQNKVPKSPGNLLCYILDETDKKRRFIESVAEHDGLTPFRVNSLAEDSKAAIEQRIQPPVEQWLRGFYDAEFIITDSFHACVFSILFNKPFVAILNRKRGLMRFESLLKTFGLQDRMIDEDGDYILPSASFSPNFDKLEEMKQKSLSFLKGALG